MTSTVLLLAGYAAAVPFTLFVPGFLRLWRRREAWTFLTAQTGAALVVAGWALRGSAPAALVNAGWLAGLAVAYAVEGRTRART